MPVPCYKHDARANWRSVECATSGWRIFFGGRDNGAWAQWCEISSSPATASPVCAADFSS